MTARRWTGRAQIEGRHIARVRFEAGDVTKSAWIGGRTLVLATGSGPVTVDLSSTSLKMFPEAERSGTWSDIESDPRSKPFAESAPGPHVRVKLIECSVDDGDEMAIAGTLDEKGGYVRASILAVGSKALDVLEREDPSPELATQRHVRARPPLWVAAACALVAIGIAAVARAIPYSPASLDLAAFASVVLAWGLHRATRSALVFRSSSGPLDPRPWGNGFHIPVGISLLFFAGVDTGGDWPGHMNEGHQQNGSPLILGFFVVYLLCLLVDFIRSGRKSSRLARVMLAAPRAARDRWGAVDGTARTHEERAAVYALLEEEWRDGSGSNAHIDSQYQAPFTIVPSASGAMEVRVEPKNQACWAADEVERTRKSASPREEKVVLERTEIKTGTRVLAVGRLHATGDRGHLAPTGPESLLLFASAERSPRAVLAFRVALRLLTVLALFAAILGCATLAYVQPDMPPENLPDTN